jgi:hypothetical protein
MWGESQRGPQPYIYIYIYIVTKATSLMILKGFEFLFSIVLKFHSIIIAMFYSNWFRNFLNLYF